MNIKPREIIKAIENQLPEKPSEVALLGSPHRRNSWTFKSTYKNEKVVIKVIKPSRIKEEVETPGEEEILNRIKKRKDISAVQYSEKGSVSIRNRKLLYFIFPFIQGADLNKLIHKKGKFSEKDTQKILTQLFEEVLKLAEEGVVHQDIKPGNIIVDSNGKVYLLDFGIAKFLDYDHSLAKQQGPARYLSPEQVNLGLKRIPQNQRKVNFLSDIYSSCVVALHMLLGNDFYSGWKTDERSRIVSELKENTLLKLKNDKLKEMLLIGLQEHSNKRVAVLNILSKDLSRFIRDKKPGFTPFWNLHGWVTGTKILTTFAKENPNIRGGVIFQSEHVQSVENAVKKAKELQKMGWRVAIDPSTYKLGFLEEHYAYLNERDYYRSSVEPELLHDPQFLKSFVSDTLEFQRLFSPDLYISPYFYIKDIDSEYLNINFNLFKEVRRQLSKSTTPVLFGMALSQDIIKDDKKRNEIIDQLIFYPTTNAYYFRPELLKQNNQPCSDKKYLLGLKKLVEQITVSNSLIISQTDQSILGVFANNKISVAINPEAAVRKQDIGKKYMTRRSSGGPSKQDRRTWVYIPELLNDIDLQRDLRREPLEKFSDYKTINCSCKYCLSKTRGIDPLETNLNRHSHFLLSFNNQVQKIINSKDRKTEFKSMVDKAKKLYKKIDKENIKLDGENSGNFLMTWEEVFISF